MRLVRKRGFDAIDFASGPCTQQQSTYGQFLLRHKHCANEAIVGQRVCVLLVGKRSFDV